MDDALFRDNVPQDTWIQLKVAGIGLIVPASHAQVVIISLMSNVDVPVFVLLQNVEKRQHSLTQILPIMKVATSMDKQLSLVRHLELIFQLPNAFWQFIRQAINMPVFKLPTVSVVTLMVLEELQKRLNAIRNA